MKKQLSLLLAAGMTAGLLAGCGGATSSTATESQASSTSTAATGETSGDTASADITMWTYPIGKFGDAEAVDSMIAKFQESHPGINVTVEYLDYTNGDDQVTAAIEAAPPPTSSWKVPSAWSPTGAPRARCWISATCGPMTPWPTSLP